MRIDEKLEITEFVEKPKDAAVIEGLKVGDSVRKRMSDPGDADYCLALDGDLRLQCQDFKSGFGLRHH
jgi:hypothetical protein